MTRANPTQLVTPRAMQTCRVPRPSAMTSAISSSRVGIDDSVVMTNKHRVVDAAAEVAGAHAEEQREGDDDQAREAADQQGDAHALEGLQQDVAAEQIGAEQVAAGEAQRRAAVELDRGERGGVAASRGSRAGTTRSMTLRGWYCATRSPCGAAAGAADPGDRVERADQQVGGDGAAPAGGGGRDCAPARATRVGAAPGRDRGVTTG